MALTLPYHTRMKLQFLSLKNAGTKNNQASYREENPQINKMEDR